MAKNEHRLNHAHVKNFQFPQKNLVGFNIIDHLKSCVWNFKSTSTKKKFLITLQNSQLKASK